MSDDKKNKLTPAKNSFWGKFLQKAVELDKRDAPHQGWYWFFGLYYLYDTIPEYPYFILERVQKELPEKHWLKNINDDKLKDIFATDTCIEFFEFIADLTNKYKIPRIINFSKLRFDNHVSFVDYIFPLDVSFEHTEFSDGAFFDLSIFYGDCNFNKTQFSDNITFNKAIFYGLANFTEAHFIDGVSFNRTSFLGIAYFQNTIFSEMADFYGATLSRLAVFRGAKFSILANFGNADISGSANFIDAHFKTRAPYFHDTKVGTGIIWDRNPSLWPQSKQDKNNETDLEYKNRTINNRNDYENLVSHMKKLDKHQDEHFFFRQQMQWQRRENKITQHPQKYLNWRQAEDTITLLFYWLYEIFADYGYGIGRAFVWWAGHIVLGAIAIMITAFCAGMGLQENLFCSVSASVANANPYVFLGVNEGSLADCYERLNALSPRIFGAIRGIQTIFGIALLFLLLLTLRIRFRLR